MFLHDLVLECLVCGNTEVPCEKFSTAMDDLKKVDVQTGKSGIQKQFEVLEELGFIMRDREREEK